ncbi:hypothetical protein CH373_11115 [Leptospira perolatii]|uniref:ChsH2 C-terminal OB-fold domain-containing protein n=1 Tax=Leptospira perolatii TaxID=2023191 RepID=A0A2M9ZLZ7_9LEPT|nr:OB-fold domain-containing protein [Leptospira perolatii]PJZ69746.1 hypothetical protein CH360_09120 [Leptospira perolatii]PJZ73039.1 hypothetical protein CH373_11115 [Leptospira perolatii]
MKEANSNPTIIGTKCQDCGFQITENVPRCIQCGSEKIQKIEYEGSGTIYTYTVVHVGFGHMAARAPYVLALVELREGVKALGILEGSAKESKITESVSIGLEVRLQKIDSEIGYFFRPV